jgi:hypothetical protein
LKEETGKFFQVSCEDAINFNCFMDWQL